MYAIRSYYAFINIWSGQRNGMRRAQTIFLYDIAARKFWERFFHEFFDLVAVFISDKNQINGFKSQQATDDVFKDGFPGDVDQGFGFSMGMRPQTGAFACHR